MKKITSIITILFITNCSTIKSKRVNSCKTISNLSTTQKEKKESHEYYRLKQECQQKYILYSSIEIIGTSKNFLRGCLNTVKHMKKYGYKKADIDKNGKASCPNGFRSMLFRNMGSFAWCEPLDINH